MKNNRAYRVTAIPRSKSPGAAYHPMYFAKKYGDEVLPIPGHGKSIVDCNVSCSERVFNNQSLRFIKVAFMIELLLIALSKNGRRRDIYVHSFWYVFPFILVGLKPTLIIHGSDFKSLSRPILGRFVKNNTKNIFVVGKQKFCKKVGVTSIPNIFKSDISTPSKEIERNIDFLFILRNAEVKNPKFPDRLFDSLNQDENVTISVIGIEGENRTVNGNTITFEGVIGTSDVQKFLLRSKVFVLPSLHEGIPKVVFEAMSNGCSIVANKGLELPIEVHSSVTFICCESKVHIERFLSTLDVESSLENRKTAERYLRESETILEKIYK